MDIRYGSGPDPRLLNSEHCALFLDVDGTLLDFAARPEDVHVDGATRALLARLQIQLDGAIALISGRSLAQLDRLFEPLELPAAGIHGFERRSASGVVHRPSSTVATLDRIRKWLRGVVLPDSGLTLEDKGHALALHYRTAPQNAARARASVRTAAAQLGPAYEVIEGSKVVELKPAGSTKATAIDAFMKEAPFKGRMPVFLGDDVTDFDGFAAVRNYGGMDVAVGDRVSARWYLEGPRATHRWLTELADCIGKV